MFVLDGFLYIFVFFTWQFVTFEKNDQAEIWPWYISVSVCKCISWDVILPFAGSFLPVSSYTYLLYILCTRSNPAYLFSDKGGEIYSN